MRYITRDEWGARPPRSRRGLSAPQGLAVHWVGPGDGPNPHADCADQVRRIQRFHMDPKPKGRGWADVAYSFLVCEHGTVYEGRGWATRTAANGTNAGNSWGHAACVLVGEGDAVPDAVFTALLALREEHRRRYGVTDLRPHSSFKATACPGPVLARWIALGCPAPKTEQATTAEEYEPMKRGDTGNDVAKMQVRLKGVGHYAGKIDGDYGPKTEAGVSAFQEAHGLDVSGAVSLWTAVHLQAVAHGLGSHA